MIHFDVTEVDGDRELRLEGTDVLVGWIEQGRKMIDSRGRWTEWGFVPASPGGKAGETRRTISEAYTDARNYASALVTE